VLCMDVVSVTEVSHTSCGAVRVAQFAGACPDQKLDFGSGRCRVVDVGWLFAACLHLLVKSFLRHWTYSQTNLSNPQLYFVVRDRGNFGGRSAGHGVGSGVGDRELRQLEAGLRQGLRYCAPSNTAESYVKLRAMDIARESDEARWQPRRRSDRGASTQPARTWTEPQRPRRRITSWETPSHRPSAQGTS
jgi:hypothetical protein